MDIFLRLTIAKVEEDTPLMTLDEICEDPNLRDLPFKIETNQRGQIVMSPAQIAAALDAHPKVRPQDHLLAWELHLGADPAHADHSSRKPGRSSPTAMIAPPPN